MLGLQHSTWYRALLMHMHATSWTACALSLCIAVSADACMKWAAESDCHHMFAMHCLGKRRGCWECGGVLSTSGVTHIPAYTIAVLHNRLAFDGYALYLLSCLYDTALILICIILILCRTAKCACSLPIVARNFSDMLQYEQVTWHSVSM